MSVRTRWIVGIIVGLYLALIAFCVAAFCSIAFVIPAMSCDRDIKSPQTTDVSLLEHSTWPLDAKRVADILDLGIFDSYEITDSEGRFVRGKYRYREDDDNASYSKIDVDIELFESTEYAEKSFWWTCEHQWYKPDLSDFTYGDGGGSQYCISYVRQARATPDGLCRPLGYYSSFVVFQKGNLLIVISEETSDKASTMKEDVIKQLARELGE